MNRFTFSKDHPAAVGSQLQVPLWVEAAWASTCASLINLTPLTKTVGKMQADSQLEHCRKGGHSSKMLFKNLIKFIIFLNLKDRECFTNFHVILVRGPC